MKITGLLFALVLAACALTGCARPADLLDASAAAPSAADLA